MKTINWIHKLLLFIVGVHRKYRAKTLTKDINNLRIPELSKLLTAVFQKKPDTVIYL